MSASWFDEFTPQHVRHLDVYQPGKPIEELERELGITGAIKVASNENPLGPSPKALAALPTTMSTMQLYPDAGGFALRRALSTRYGVPIENIALGNGSNDMLYQLVLAATDPTDEVLSHKYAFLSYRLSAQVAGRPFVAAPTTPELGLDVDALIAAITPKTKLVILGSPNNPTGSVVKVAEAERVLKALPPRALLVIDEAYSEYAAQWPEVDHVDGLTLQKQDRRVIVLRTFSKIYGLAGLRVGFGIADPAIINVLGRVGRTFHVSTPAMVAAIAALDDHEHVAISAKHARAAIEAIQGLKHGPGVKIYPSLANFVLIDCGKPSTPVYDKLLRMGVIVRPMAAWGLPNCIRVSVPAHPDLPRVVGALEEVLA